MKQKIKKGGFFFLRAYDRVIEGSFHAAAWMILLMTLIITYDVIARYFFNSPTIWAGDITDYIMLYSTFLASAWLLKQGGHVRLTILIDRTSPRFQPVLEIINSSIGAIACGLITWFGVGDCLDAIKKGIDIPRLMTVPRYLIIWVIPFGCLLLFIQSLRDAMKFINTLKKRP